MPAQPISINLLNPDPFSSSAIGKVLTWALSVGRYIVVFTELIVILSFISRFKLDRDLTDLNTEIIRQQSIVESYGDLETEIRQLQSSLDFIREKKMQPRPQNYLDMLVPLLPVDVRLEQLQLNPDTIKVTASALSQQGFREFIQALERQPLVETLDLSQVAMGETAEAIDFELTVILDQKEIEASLSL